MLRHLIVVQKMEGSNISVFNEHHLCLVNKRADKPISWAKEIGQNFQFSQEISVETREQGEEEDMDKPCGKIRRICPEIRMRKQLWAHI